MDHNRRVASHVVEAWCGAETSNGTVDSGLLTPYLCGAGGGPCGHCLLKRLCVHPRRWVPFLVGFPKQGMTRFVSTIFGVTCLEMRPVISAGSHPVSAADSDGDVRDAWQ